MDAPTDVAITVTLTPEQADHLGHIARWWIKSHAAAIAQREAAKADPSHWARIGGQRQMDKDVHQRDLWRGILAAIDPEAIG